MKFCTHALVYPTIQRILGICKGGGVHTPKQPPPPRYGPVIYYCKSSGTSLKRRYQSCIVYWLAWNLLSHFPFWNYYIDYLNYNPLPIKLINQCRFPHDLIKLEFEQPLQDRGNKKNCQNLGGTKNFFDVFNISCSCTYFESSVRGCHLKKTKTAITKIFFLEILYAKILTSWLIPPNVGPA